MTEQICEKLHFNGQVFDMCCEPLEEYLKIKGIEIVITGSITSCLWRGYIGTWSIQDEKLYLLELNEFNSKEVDITPNLKTKDCPIFCSWFSGELMYREGECLNSFHGGFGGEYEYETYLKFKQGILESSHTIKNVKDEVTRKISETDFDDLPF